MKRVIFFLLFIVNVSFISAQSGIGALLPGEGDLPGWQVEGNPEIYRGDRVNPEFNGKADIINEYGLRETIAARIAGDNGGVVDVKIYRMKDSFGAFALYLMKNPGNGGSCTLGNDCFTAGNTLSFWKLHYTVVLTLDEPCGEPCSALDTVGMYIDSRIRSAGKWPDIFSKVDHYNGRVTLIRGKLALSDIYHFTSRDIFRIEEGIAIERDDETEIMLKYRSVNESVQRLGEVAGFLSREGRFDNFRMSGDLSFSMIDDNGNEIEIISEDNWLRIVISGQNIY